jgi:hypothetical protein
MTHQQTSTADMQVVVPSTPTSPSAVHNNQVERHSVDVNLQVVGNSPHQLHREKRQAVADTTHLTNRDATAAAHQIDVVETTEVNS